MFRTLGRTLLGHENAKLNFNQRPTFSGLTFFIESQIRDPQLKVLGGLILMKKSMDPRNLGLEATILPQNYY